MIKRKLFRFIPIFGMILIASCSLQKTPTRFRIHLGGTWNLQLSPSGEVLENPWTMDSSETVQLPGTLDENGKGDPVTEVTDKTLTRLVKYEGPAVYQKQVSTPYTWADKRIHLTMERTKVTQVWVDSILIGSQERLFSPQIFDLSEVLKPGDHLLTLVVDNTLSLVPVEGSHAYSEDTQTNWNGILGDFYLEAGNSTAIDQVRITPDIHKKEIGVLLKIRQPAGLTQKAELKMSAKGWNTDIRHDVPAVIVPVTLSAQDTVIEVTYSMGDACQFWSEFNPAMYTLETELLINDEPADRVSHDYGMREFKNVDSQFQINGITTFLRGKHEAAVFPLTGYPPMETEAWVRLYEIAKSYGINHYRFHSWTPPAAAFRAADICGIYLQPETPVWWSFDSKDSEQMDFMIQEGKGILDAAGNHPSFVMFSLGNEIYQDRADLKNMIDTFRAHDSRHLYAQGSNNRGSNPSQAEGDDFWVSFRTDEEREDLSSDIRGSISFVDAVDGGQINTLYPSTRKTYCKAIEEATIPVIGHEIGQFQVYPDYETELPKYTGVLRPGNLQLFQEKLEKAGMGDQVKAFHRASGALSVLCYREDIERALRTPGFGGFQLLDLQDFPGQGTALVGLLDAFMESKGLIAPGQFRQFCDEVVIQAMMDKYCWTNDELFTADIHVANFSPSVLQDVEIEWQLKVSETQTVNSGVLSSASVPNGGLIPLGQIETALSGIDRASRADLILKSADLNLEIEYPLWIYPEDLDLVIPEGITVAKALTQPVLDQLKQGEIVLLFPDHETVKDKSVGGQFITEFWNYGMFTMLAEQWGRRKSHGTMGILTDPEHPLFIDFPTEFHTNWQWWAMTKHSRPFILDETDSDYRPVIQVVDNINRNHKLGLVFEGRMGEGKLLVSMIDLPAIQHYPEARQLYHSLLTYLDSDHFDPEYELGEMLF